MPGSAVVLIGNCLRLLDGLDPGFDVVCADPPYCSGGAAIAAKQTRTAHKYCQSGEAGPAHYRDFDGDAKNQLAWFKWSAVWLRQCYELAKPGAYLFMFTDWRQLGAAVDVLQAGDWQYRGVVVWDKGGGARAPHTGYFRHQAEYIVWGSKGKLPRQLGRGPFPGVIRCPVERDKRHQCGKPVPMLRQLVRAVPPGGLLLDPFTGSGSALLAGAAEGLHCVGIESDPLIVAEARSRLAAASVPCPVAA